MTPWEMKGRELAHFPCAEQNNFFPRKIFKDFPGQLHCGRAGVHRGFADPGI